MSEPKLHLPDPYEINENDAQEMLEELQKILWVEVDPDDGPFPNPDKEWDSATLDALAGVLVRLRPRPKGHTVRQLTYRVSILTIDREEQAAYSAVQLAQLIIAQDAAKQAGVRPYPDYHVESVALMANKELGETDALTRLKAAGREVPDDDEG